MQDAKKTSSSPEVVEVSSSEAPVMKKPSTKRGSTKRGSTKKRPAAEVTDKLPYLKMYYSKTGKAALKDNSKKQVFQFGSKECSKEYLYEILDRAIEMILNERLEVDNAKAWCSAQV